MTLSQQRLGPTMDNFRSRQNWRFSSTSSLAISLQNNCIHVTSHVTRFVIKSLRKLLQLISHHPRLESRRELVQRLSSSSGFPDLSVICLVSLRHLKLRVNTMKIQWKVQVKPEPPPPPVPLLRAAELLQN